MSTQQFDLTRYKAGQQKEWGAAAAGWKDWGHVIGPELQPITDRMMELAEIRPGQQVLDVAKTWASLLSLPLTWLDPRAGS